VGARGHLAAVPRPGRLPADHRLSQGARGQQQRLHERHPVEDHRPAGLRRHPRLHLRAHQAHLLHLPQDARAEQDDRRAVRPLCLPRDRGQHRRLLQRARPHPRPVQPHPGAVQGLYLHPEAQHVPVAAHDGHRLAGHPLRGADPHLGDAPDGRIRRRGALEIQAERRRRHRKGI